MIRAAIDVTGKDGRFTVAVHAANLRQAVALVAEQYQGREVAVVFPLDPETFFVEDSGMDSSSGELLLIGERP